jgi:hypothetical protein
MLKSNGVVFVMGPCLNLEEIEAECEECKPHTFVAPHEASQEIGTLATDVRRKPLGDIRAGDASTVVTNGDRVVVSVQCDPDLSRLRGGPGLKGLRLPHFGLAQR